MTTLKEFIYTNILDDKEGCVNNSRTPLVCAPMSSAAGALSSELKIKNIVIATNIDLGTCDYSCHACSCVCIYLIIAASKYVVYIYAHFSTPRSLSLHIICIRAS